MVPVPSNQIHLLAKKNILTTTMRSNVNLAASDHSYIVIRGLGNALLPQNVFLLLTNENNNACHFLFGACGIAGTALFSKTEHLLPR